MLAVKTCSMMGVQVNSAMKKLGSVRWAIATTLKIVSARQFLSPATAFGYLVGGVPHARWNIAVKVKGARAAAVFRHKSLMSV